MRVPNILRSQNGWLSPHRSDPRACPAETSRAETRNKKAMNESEFVEFPKIARLSRECIITEKIDGTNACIFINDAGEIRFGSRTRWITQEDDNFGFARWATAHKQELLTLGPGRHFGEWWGNGIQRGYGLEMGEKRLSLFNVSRWCLHGQTPAQIPTSDPRIIKVQEVLPQCVGLVPILWRGLFSTESCSTALERLKELGSQASPGFTNPEGIVVYHVAGNVGFKKTIEGDDEWKGQKRKENHK